MIHTIHLIEIYSAYFTNFLLLEVFDRVSIKIEMLNYQILNKNIKSECMLEHLVSKNLIAGSKKFLIKS